MTHISNHNDPHDNNSSPIVGEMAKALGLEYRSLLSMPVLSDAQEERLTHILELALSHEEVNFWVSHLTCIQGMEDGLLSEHAKKEYEDQKALLRERLGQSGLPPIRGRSALSIDKQLLEQIEDEKVAQLRAAIRNADQN